MAGTWRKMGVYLGLVEDDLDDLDNQYDEISGDEESPVHSRQSQPATGQPRADVRAAEPRVVDARGEREMAGEPRYRSMADSRAMGESRAIPEPRSMGESRARASASFATRAPVASGVPAAPAPAQPPGLAPADHPTPTRASTASAAVPRRISAQHPRSYNDALRIGEEFRDGAPVIINLTGMEDRDAKRIVDFSAGLVFGMHGSIERITNKVFLLSPANVDVGAEARARVAQDGFFNQS